MRHISVLASQLPRESRCIKAIVNHEWDEQMQLLVSMEHELRTLIWVQANQMSKHRTPAPKRIQSPTERLEFEHKVISTDLDELNTILGIRG